MYSSFVGVVVGGCAKDSPLAFKHHEVSQFGSKANLLHDAAARIQICLARGLESRRSG